MANHTRYVVQNNDIRPIRINDESALAKLPACVYTVGEDMSGFFLTRSELFELPKKLYGDLTVRTNRILKTFQERGQQTGVMLTGEKGSGKTLLAKFLGNTAVEQGYPVILINSPRHGEAFNQFVKDLDTPCVFIFDEFEKVYDKAAQSEILTLFDGTVGMKNLFIVTVNDVYRVSDYMRNRPGRMFYRFDYDSLSRAFMSEYIDDTLKQEHMHMKDACLKLLRSIRSVNFDMLKALIEEINRYGEQPKAAIRWLNIEPDALSMERLYQMEVFVNNVRVPTEMTDMNDTVSLTLNDLHLCPYIYNKFEQLLGVSGQADSQPQEDDGVVVSSMNSKIMEFLQPDVKHRDSDEFMLKPNFRERDIKSGSGGVYKLSKRYGEYLVEVVLTTIEDDEEETKPNLLDMAF